MNSVEYEKKCLLSLEVYNQLVKKLNQIVSCSEIIQVNYYYDDSKYSLFEKGETIRVRQKSDVLSLERKYNKHYSDNGSKVCDESSDNIFSLPLCISLDNKTYNYIGNMITIRKNYYINENVVSLDTSYYLGVIDYEIEIESNKDVIIPDFITNIFNFDNQQSGKYTRFVERLKGMSSEYGN